MGLEGIASAMRVAGQAENAAFADMARHCGSGWRDHSGSSRILSFVVQQIRNTEQTLTSAYVLLPSRTRGRLWFSSWAPERARVSIRHQLGPEVRLPDSARRRNRSQCNLTRPFLTKSHFLRVCKIYQNGLLT
jgi:hypothetical protein